MVQVKYSHLDIAGRPVLVLEKPDVIPEHNLHFQVYLSLRHQFVHLFDDNLEPCQFVNLTQ